MHTLRRLTFAAALLAGAAPVAFAQQPDWDPRRAQVTRESLQVLLTRLDASAASPVYSAKLRERSRQEAGLIRARLEGGDLQVGDRIFVTVEGDTSFAETLTVEAGRVLNVTRMGAVAVSGVLRSELTDYLTREFRRFMANARVRAHALVRVSIVGEVGRPGFYTLPVETLVDVALVQAGGPSALARLEEIRIERGREVLWDADALQQAIIEGRTFNALGLRAGDRIVVPGKSRRNFESTARTVAIAASLPFTIVGLGRLLGF